MDSQISIIEKDTLKLSQLLGEVQEVIQQHFSRQTFWITAEVSGIKRYEDRRQCYFELIEKDNITNKLIASVRASIFGTAYSTIQEFERATAQVFTDHLELLLKVKIDYHPAFGLKLNVLSIDPQYTIGKLALQKQAVLQDLLKNNPETIQFIDGEYITKNKQLKDPAVIQNIALITSANSDGCNDFLHELQHNKYGYKFCIDFYFSQVQGMKAAAEMTEKLLKIFYAIRDEKKHYDAVVIVRGGGSQVDFGAFDTFKLAQAVARFPVPVITGIGHERNESVTDMMAHTKTKTPTKAAAYILTKNHAFENDLLALQNRLVAQVKVHLSANELLVSNAKALIINKTQHLLNKLQSNFYPLANAISQATLQHIESKRSTLFFAGSQLARHSETLLNKSRFELERQPFMLNDRTAGFVKDKQFALQKYSTAIQYLSPLNVLKRGYAILYKDDKIITSTEGIEAGTAITARLYHSKIESLVTRRTTENEPDATEL